MFVRCECCVLSGRGLCDELITRPEESYRLCCVVVCALENLKNEEAMTRVGSQRHSKKKSERRFKNYANDHRIKTAQPRCQELIHYCHLLIQEIIREIIQAIYSHKY
jgi:hypothetical protein